MLPIRGVVFALLPVGLLLAPLTLKAADLVVWWEKGFYPQADEAVAEIVAAFERQTGKKVELLQPLQDTILDESIAAVQAGTPPDFLFSTIIEARAAQWAYEDRLVDLTDALGRSLDLFDRGVDVDERQVGSAGARRPANGPHVEPPAFLGQPSGAGRVRARGHSQAMDGVLVVLV